VTICLALLGTTPLPAQVTSKSLGQPEAEFAQPFDAVQAIRELRGGRVFVTDLGPKSVLLADFRAGSQTTVGRNGQGPGEYQFPGELLSLAGDTTLLVDRVSRRFLVVTGDGNMGRSIPFPDGIKGLGDPRGADRQGRIYFQGSPFSRGPGDTEFSQATDSVPLLRWDRGANRIDTVTRVKVPALKMQLSGGQNSRMVMVRPQPFAPADEWAVAADGRVAVARVGDYHVEWLDGRAPVHGAPVRFERLKVRDDDKRAFLDNMRTSRNRITINRGGAGRGADPRPPEPRAEDFDWPEYKPPFVPRTGLISPEGQFWLARSVAGRDSTPAFDVFDQTGALVAQVTLPKGRRVVGLGDGTLYAVRTDGDGLQWLERYRR
jgi:hypothetical protein